jgi:hypothetical protein
MLGVAVDRYNYRLTLGFLILYTGGSGQWRSEARI